MSTGSVPRQEEAPLLASCNCGQMQFKCTVITTYHGRSAIATAALLEPRAICDKISGCNETSLSESAFRTIILHVHNNADMLLRRADQISTSYSQQTQNTSVESSGHLIQAGKLQSWDGHRKQGVLVSAGMTAIEAKTVPLIVWHFLCAQISPA